MEKLSIHDIKSLTEKKSPYFFTRKTLQFFGQTMSSFKVKKMLEGERHLIYAPMISRMGDFIGYTVRVYNPLTNGLEFLDEQDKIEAIKLSKGVLTFKNF